MKKTLIIGFVALLVFACKNKEEESFGKQEETSTVESASSEGMKAATPEKMGESLFNGKGNCFSCHKIDTKSIGPSVQEIAKIYKDKNQNMVSFLRGESDAIVDPTQFEVMKANFAITKAMSEEELKAIEAYFYSHLK
ncbi:c-type cytochrome [Flavobacterium sp. K5-23]|uniref:c-type cytochrome n=1 Tax=Flavobacterium sp. K5-23 TaxID=2746225 RepID=UPI00200F7FF7|nr:c-type cytochrome [Flavobacterium sp. K5-23]UQD55642.1 c-type cytochrome [Flavobacterium sp. K5-23]